jgi:hypothetical protein
MKKELNNVIITKDGWVYVITPEKQFGLGDIDVDCLVTDLRPGKRKGRKEMALSLKESGLTQTKIARELNVTRQAVSQWFKGEKL